MTFPTFHLPENFNHILGELQAVNPLPIDDSFCFYREVTEKRADEAYAKGYPLRSFFPHQLYFLPKCGPDGFKLAERIFGRIEPNQCWEIVLYACPSYSREFPNELFFDKDLVWHQQHFDKPGQIATANLMVQDQKLYTLLHISDIVQRISRRREYKTRIESRFKGWHLMLLNSICNFALEQGLPKIYSPTSALAIKHTSDHRNVQPELFERVYDRDIHRLFTARKEDEWWVIDVQENRSRIFLAEKKSQVMKKEKTICICHDIERGLGHRSIDDPFAEIAERTAPEHLVEMLSMEKELGVLATYNVVGILLPEVRDQIEESGHCLAFHSYDHKLDDTSTQYLYQVSKCRLIDYRLKGYRAPQSKLTPELIPRILCKHNYEWLASSAWSLKAKKPSFKDRLVRIPILFDDFDLFKRRLSYDEWEAKAIRQIQEHDFVAFGLHDCYAQYWLPHYRDFLKKIRGMGRLRTLDQIAHEVYLAHSV